MRRALSLLSAAALVIGALVLGATPASSQTGGFAYTIVSDGDGGCALSVIDLETAEVEVLADDYESSACVADLAAGPDGSVWGLLGSEDRGPIGTDGFGAQGVVPAALVEFDPVSGEVLDIGQLSIEGADDATLNYGGLAIDGAGTVWAQIVSEACDGGDAVCLYTIDPATGVATEVGSSGLPITYLDGLALCGDLITQVLPDLDRAAPAAGYPTVEVGVVDTTTGEVDPGPDTGYKVGFDCGGESTGYSLAVPVPQGGLDPQAFDVVLEAFDPATGDDEFIAAVDPELDIELLAIPVAPTPPPTTTTTTAAPTTTTTAAAQPAVVTPRFTG